MDVVQRPWHYCGWWIEDDFLCCFSYFILRRVKRLKMCFFSFSNMPSSYHNKHYGKIEYSLKVVMDKTGDIFDKKIKVLLGILNPQHYIDYPQYMVSFEKLNLAIGGRSHGCYISNKQSLLDQGHLMPQENYINLHVMLHCDFQM